jgi:hypothetical protein
MSLAGSARCALVEFSRDYFVNIRYEPFDASGKMPLPSGIIGKVALVRLR